jgi:hypothetical protein
VVSEAMRNDIRSRIVDLIIEYKEDNEEVRYKEFLHYLKLNNEFNMRAHVVQNRFMFNSMVREAFSSSNILEEEK